MFSYLDDEHSDRVAKLDFPLMEALATILSELDPNTTMGCIKMLGEIVTSSEHLTTQIVGMP